MALKKFYEMTNVAIADASEGDKYLITLPEDFIEFPTVEFDIPTNISKVYHLIVGTKTRETGRTEAEDLADDDL